MSFLEVFMRCSEHFKVKIRQFYDAEFFAAFVLFFYSSLDVVVFFVVVFLECFLVQWPKHVVLVML